MDLEVRHLRTLTTVASLGSVTKAAAVLGVAQPALSAQLSRIDRTLGGPAFVRDHRGVRPTPLGLLVLDRARVLVPAMDALLQDAQRLAQGDAPRALRVACAGSALGAGLVAALTATGVPAPTLQTVDDPVAAAARLAAGADDAVLAGTCGDALPPAAPGVRWRLVGTDAVLAVVPADAPCGDDVDLADLADARWAVSTHDACLDACFARACARAGFTPRAPARCDRATAVELAGVGAAVALVEPFGRLTADVRAVTLRGAPVTWSTWLCLRDDAAPDLRSRVTEAAQAARRDQGTRTWATGDRRAEAALLAAPAAM